MDSSFSPKSKKQNGKSPAMNLRVSTGRKNQLFLFIFVTFLVTTLYYFKFWEETLNKSRLLPQNIRNETTFNANHRINHRLPGFAVYTPGCRIPELNAFDKSVLKYIEVSKTVQCSDKLPLIQSNQTSLWIDENALGGYNVTLADLRCCYLPFVRAQAKPGRTRKNIDNIISLHTYCQKFEKDANIFNEFVQVTCFVNDTIVYKDFHAFIVPKIRKPDPGFEKEPEGLSVLIVGVDSLSRSNFYRQMPKTKEFLHSIGAIEFFGYNKVEDNTFPNLVPFLSGYSVKEIQSFCWFNDTDFFDDCPWIWKNFSSRNYHTAFVEDCADIGLFNYLKNGFLYEPTDYYLRPYIYANEKFIGHMKLLNTRYCVGARTTLDVLVDYAYKFSVNMTLSNKKFWGFFWHTSFTHDFLNVPPNVDNAYFEFFRKMEALNLLNRTMVIFLSDHGMRWGAIRETYQGRMEEHLPYLFLLFPDWFKKKYGLAVRNMMGNTHMLTTHFDVHETMKDILNESSLEDEVLGERITQMKINRGISLFFPVPENRTCSSAGIEPTWCTCQGSKSVPTATKNVRKAAKTAVKYLNMLLADFKQCAMLKLKKIWFVRLESEEGIMKGKFAGEFSDYIINFETKPGDARFEALVRHRPGSNEMTVLGDIVRTNIYGNQSECVSRYRMKPYCFCRS